MPSRSSRERPASFEYSERTCSSRRKRYPIRLSSAPQKRRQRHGRAEGLMSALGQKRTSVRSPLYPQKRTLPTLDATAARLRASSAHANSLLKPNPTPSIISSLMFCTVCSASFSHRLIFVGDGALAVEGSAVAPVAPAPPALPKAAR